jgi:hypothetical protein
MRFARIFICFDLNTKYLTRHSLTQNELFYGAE